MGQADRWAGGPAGAAPIGKGAAGPAPQARPGPAEGAVRGGRGPAGPAAYPRGLLRRAAHRGLRRAELPAGARHRPQPVLDRQDPLPPGVSRVSHAAADGPGRDRHPGPARRRDGLCGQPGRGRPGPQAAAPAAPGHARTARPGLRRQRLLARGRRDRGDAAGPRHVHPPPAGAGAPARRLLPVGPGRPAGADHRGRPGGDRRRRQPRRRQLPTDHHADRLPPLSRRRLGPPTTSGGRSNPPTSRCGTPC
jgi:hypothetical protein